MVVVEDREEVQCMNIDELASDRLSGKNWDALENVIDRSNSEFGTQLGDFGRKRQIETGKKIRVEKSNSRSSFVSLKSRNIENRMSHLERSPLHAKRFSIKFR